MEKFLDGLKLEKDHIDCFKNHILEIQSLGEIKIYNFSKKNSNDHKCRLVLDGPRAYFTGDIGCFTWEWYGSPITLEGLAGFGMYYFTKKMVCGTDIEKEWDSELAEREFKERMMDDRYYGDHEMCKEIIDEMEHYFEDEIEYVSGLRQSSIDELDPDHWEWAYNIGKRTPTRYYMWLLSIRLMQDRINKGDFTNK